MTFPSLASSHLKVGGTNSSLDCLEESLRSHRFTVSVWSLLAAFIMITSGHWSDLNRNFPPSTENLLLFVALPLGKQMVPAPAPNTCPCEVLSASNTGTSYFA